MKTINIAMALDDNYVYPTITAVDSIRDTGDQKDTRYAFSFLVPERFSSQGKELLEKTVKRFYNGSLKFFFMDDRYASAYLRIRHTTTPTFYRLSLPQLLPDVDKILYLDSDIIAKQDVSGLYETDISDSYIAGVRALTYFETEKHIEAKRKELELPSLEQYVNAGVLLMNLKKMREDKLQDRFLKLLDKNFRTQDQDVMNVACYGKIKRLPFAFNAMTKYPLDQDKGYEESSYLSRCITKEDWDEGRLHPVIIHYADKKKPWNRPDCVYAEDWWKAAGQLPAEMFQDLVAFSRKQMRESLEELEAENMRQKDELNKTKNENASQIQKQKKTIEKQKNTIRKQEELLNSRTYRFAKKLQRARNKFRINKA